MRRRTTSGRSRRSSRLSPAHLAGWLFADLMLVLFLVAMAVQPRAELTTGSPDDDQPTPTPTPSGPRVLGQDFCEFLIPVEAQGLIGGSRAARDDLLGKVDQALRRERPSWLDGPEMEGAQGRAKCEEHLEQNRQVGFYLVYGARNDTGSGVRLGQNAAEAIKEGNPRFAEAIYRAAWTAGKGNSAIQLIAFFYQN